MAYFFLNLLNLLGIWLKIILAAISLERLIILDDWTLMAMDVTGLYIWDSD